MNTSKATGTGARRDGAGRSARPVWTLAVRQRVVRAVVEQGLPLNQVARTVGVPNTTAPPMAASCGVRKPRRS